MSSLITSMEVSLESTSDQAWGTMEVLYSRSDDSPQSRSKPTLIFLPYYGGSARTYTEIQTSPSLSSFNTIALSYPSTSTTKAPDPDSPALHTSKPLAEAVMKVLQTESVRSLIPSYRITLIAHSMSAKVTYQLLQLLLSLPPSDTQLSVDKVLLIAPAPPTPLVLPPDIAAQSKIAYKSHESATYTIRNILSHVSLDANIFQRTVEDCVRTADTATAGWVELGMAEDCSPVVADIAKRLPALRVAVIVGRQDKVETLKKVEKETVGSLKELGWNVSLRVVEDCGHLLPIEQPSAVVAEILRLQDA